MNYALIQSIKYNEINIPPEWVNEATYIESMDLSGPKLIISFHDMGGILRDKGKFKEHDGVLSLVIADPGDRDKTFLEETFIIEKLNAVGDGALRLQCLAEAVSIIKRHSQGCVIYPPAPPGDTINTITKAQTLEASALPEGPGYHLLDGMRPSRLLRKLAAENGARIFYCRGIWYLKTFDDLLAAEPVATYYHNKALKPESITELVVHGHSAVAGEVVQRRAMGWDMVTGFMESGTGRPLMTGLVTEASLAAVNRTFLQDLEFSSRAAPNPDLKPSDRLSTEWHRPSDSDAPIDESLPTSVLVGTVAHHVKGSQYSQRIITLKESVPGE